MEKDQWLILFVTILAFLALFELIAGAAISFLGRILGFSQGHEEEDHQLRGYKRMTGFVWVVPQVVVIFVSLFVNNVRDNLLLFLVIGAVVSGFIGASVAVICLTFRRVQILLVGTAGGDWKPEIIRLAVAQMALPAAALVLLMIARM